MSEYSWEYCVVGAEDEMSRWHRAGASLDCVLDLDNPPKYIGVSNSATSAYMNSTLKYQYAETCGAMVKYKHYKNKHAELYFRHITTKVLVLKARDSDDPGFLYVEAYGALSGELVAEIKISRETKVSSCKAQLLEKFVADGLATFQTNLKFVPLSQSADADVYNNGRMKVVNVLSGSRKRGRSSGAAK